MIAFIAVLFSSDLFAQKYESCNGAFEMSIGRPQIEFNPNKVCYTVTIESTDGTPLDNIFVHSYEGHCTTNFGSSDTSFAASFCFGENSCGPDTPNVEETISCGITDGNGDILCLDGCVVTIGDGAIALPSGGE